MDAGERVVGVVHGPGVCVCEVGGRAIIFQKLMGEAQRKQQAKQRRGQQLHWLRSIVSSIG